MKKNMLITFIFTFLMFGIININAATYLGTFSTWFSDEFKIAYHEGGVLVHLNMIDPNSSTDISTPINHGISQWSSVKQTYRNYGNTTDNEIEIFFGTKTQILNNYGEIMGTASGICKGYSWDLQGYHTLPYGTMIDTYLITEDSITIYIVDFGSGYTQDKYKNVATHELGHALGYRGHANSSLAIMSSNVTSQTTLFGTEKDHLSQVY